MMELLKRFAALALVSGVLLTLLPEGSLRRTASMTIGLLMLLCWAEGISSLLAEVSLLPAGALAPSLLTQTGLDLTESAAAASDALQAMMEDSP